MKRYLLRISYIGTWYRGSQKHASGNVLDLDTIQGAVESAFYTFKWLNNAPNMIFAGRTDSGVHALSSAAHIDLEHKEGNETFDTKNLVKLLNRYLIKTGHEIRIISCDEVSPNFHARFSAKSRTYLYRFFVSKDPNNYQIPIAEHGRSMFLYPRSDEFDIERIKKGIRLFRGTRDFTTFAKLSKDPVKIMKRGDEITYAYKNHVRTMDVSIEEGQPLMSFDPLSQNFDYWNLYFTSRGFLYNQIRRIVAVLLNLGSNKVTEDDVMTMLQVPSCHTWNTNLSPAPPHGLYLYNIKYDQESLKGTCNSS